MKNRLIALLLSLIMVLLVVPTFAFAEDKDPSKDDSFTGTKSTAPVASSTTSTTKKDVDPSNPSKPTNPSQSTNPSSSSSTSTTKVSNTTTTANAAVKAPSATSLTYKTTSVSSVTLNWAKVDDATGYQVYKAEGKNVIKVYKTVSNNSLVEVGLKRGTDYKYQVIAFKTVNGKNYYSDSSNTVSFTTLATKISKVTKKISKKVVTLKIKPVKGAEKYVIKYSTKKNMKKAKTINSKKPNVKIKKLKKNTKYFVRVKAYKTVNGKKVFTKVKKLTFKTK